MSDAKKDPAISAKNRPLEVKLRTFTKRIWVLEITATSTVNDTNV